MDNDEKILDESSSVAVVSSVLPDASYEVKTGADLLESESGIRLMETSDHGKVSIGVTGIVNKNSELVLDKPVSDVVVSSELLNNRDFEAVNEINFEADSLGLKIETPTTKPSADQNGGHDITVQDSVDVSRAYEDEKGIVMETIEKVSDENEVDDEIKEGEYIRGGNFTIQDSADDSGASKTEKDIVVENIEKVSDANEVINEEKEVEHNGGGDTVQDSIDVLRVSGDEKEALMKVSNENEINNEEKEVEHNGGGDTVQDSIDVLRVSGDEKEALMKVSNENEIDNEEKEGEFEVTDIVWAKVKDYPWWPGQIFDPSSSTDVAKKYSNKKGFLVGYFGDQTFAWNKASKIKPFRKNFCKLEKQSNSKAFFHAVNCALDEVSRRVDFGLACSCLSKEVRDNIKSQVFVNSGIRKEACKIDGGDRFSSISTFKPVKVVQSVQELAREHFDGFNRLEVLYVRAQVLAFFRWKGYYQFQAENILDGLDNKLEDESEFPLTEKNKVVEDEKVLSEKSKPNVCDDSVPHKKEKSLTNVTPKVYTSVKGSKKNISKKAIVEDEKPASVGKKNSSKKRKPDSGDSDDSVPRKKERNLTNVTPKGNSSVKGSKKNISKKATVEENIFNGNEKQGSAGKKISSRKRKPDDCDSDDSIPHKKKRSLTNNNKTPKGNSSVKRSKKDISKKATVEGNIFNEEKGNGADNKNSSPSSPKKLFRVGDSICRIAKQISESPSILKESQKIT